MDALLDLVLIGMPRSGTSSLFYWLAQHPQINGSSPKETFFFMDPDHPLCGRHGFSIHRDGLEGYRRFFSNHDTGGLRMEATTHYFYQKTALEEFASWSKPPLVIALVRDPGSRLRSEFYYTQENIAGIDRALSFSEWTEALLNEEMSRVERYYRQKASFWIAVRQLELNCYVKWIRLWTDAVGRDRLMVISFDDIRNTPVKVLSSVCDRLGCDHAVLKDIAVERANASRAIRWQWLHRGIRKVSRNVPVGRSRAWMARAYEKIQVRGAIESSEADRLAVDRINERFRQWNRQLMQEVGVDTSSW